MSFADLDTRSINHVFTSPLATTVTYTSEDGDDTDIPVLYNLTENPFEDGKYLGKGMIAWVRETDIADPSNGETITLADGDIYVIRARDISYDGAIWKLILTCKVRATG